MLNERFVKEVEKEIKELVGEKYDVRFSEIQKNNGLILHGVSICPKDKNVAPTIYLENYLGKELSVKRMAESVIEDALCHMKEGDVQFGNIASDFKDFEFVKDKIIMVVVNANWNENLLSQVPHQKREDLALIYKVALGTDAAGMATITIRNEHMEMWGVTADQIHELAMKNTREILPVTVQSMTEIMREMFGSDQLPDYMTQVMFEEIPPKQQMYVISNSAKINGAASMFYEDELSSLSEELGTDLYILPSSVHEVIAVSTDMGTPESLSEMVKEVNGTEVSAEEQLSDNVYLFERETASLKLA